MQQGSPKSSNSRICRRVIFKCSCTLVLETTAELKKHGVRTVMRSWEVTYDTTTVEKPGVHHLDRPFDDGTPPCQTVRGWLSLCKLSFMKNLATVVLAVVLHKPQLPPP
ncbi:hypothetical protein A6R68_09548 [Neotoma lepida]|uniref:Uncharacterized protein n=1 Tax=Neotoma lepida TaxID=56216 RepID=A0A1A6FZJ4_NEOLE|nr:hypothetical protein A6R68_09548 [Neotoma lepida]